MIHVRCCVVSCPLPAAAGCCWECDSGAAVISLNTISSCCCCCSWTRGEARLLHYLQFCIYTPAVDWSRPDRYPGLRSDNKAWNVDRYVGGHIRRALGSPLTPSFATDKYRLGGHQTRGIENILETKKYLFSKYSSCHHQHFRLHVCIFHCHCVTTKKYFLC